MTTKTDSKHLFILYLGYKTLHISLQITEFKFSSLITDIQDKYYKEGKFNIALQMNDQLYVSLN